MNTNNNLNPTAVSRQHSQGQDPEEGDKISNPSIGDVVQSSLSSTDNSAGVLTRSKRKIYSVSPVIENPIKISQLSLGESDRLLKNFKFLECVIDPEYAIRHDAIQQSDQLLIPVLNFLQVRGLRDFNKKCGSNGIPSNLSLAKVDDRVGFGVFLNTDASPILRDNLVGMYTGKLTLTCSKADLGPYVFHIGNCSKTSAVYQKWLEKNPSSKQPRISIDAQEVGNYTRFINHSDSDKANLRFEFARYIDSQTEKFAILLKAKKEILPGQQLLYDYGPLYWGNKRPADVSPSTYMLAPPDHIDQSLTSGKMQKAGDNELQESIRDEAIPKRNQNNEEGKELASNPSVAPELTISSYQPLSLTQFPYANFVPQFYWPTYTHYPPPAYFFHTTGGKSEQGVMSDADFQHEADNRELAHANHDPNSHLPKQSGKQTVDANLQSSPDNSSTSSHSRPPQENRFPVSIQLEEKLKVKALNLINEWIGNDDEIPNLLNPELQKILQKDLEKEVKKIRTAFPLLPSDMCIFIAILKLQFTKIIKKRFNGFCSVVIQKSGISLSISKDTDAKIRSEIEKFGIPIVRVLNSYLFNDYSA